MDFDKTKQANKKTPGNDRTDRDDVKGTSVTSDLWSDLAFLSIVSAFNNKSHSLVLFGGDVIGVKRTHGFLDIIFAFYCTGLYQSVRKTETFLKKFLCGCVAQSDIQRLQVIKFLHLAPNSHLHCISVLTVFVCTHTHRLYFIDS